MYTPGLARHEIEIHKRTLARNELGEQTDSWSRHATCAAVIAQTKAEERFSQGGKQIINTYSTRFEIRYRTDITTEMRVKWQSKVYRIESVRDPNERRYQTTIEAVQIEEAIA